MNTVSEILPSAKGLFHSRRFLPVFVIQFLGALEDNLFRNAFFVLVAFQSASAEAASSGMVVSLGAGLFILPFFLFSGVGGALADKYEKTMLVRWLEFANFLLMLLVGTALVTEMTGFMLFVLFLLGVQAAFFGPVKYSILPQLVFERELVAANGYVEGGTFIAILLGTIMGGALVTAANGTVAIATLLCVMACGGWAVSFFIPRLMRGDSDVRLNWNPFATTAPLLRDAMRNRQVWRSILGISWFWFIGAMFLSLLPSYVKQILSGTPALVTFLLALFTIGIAVGSFLCNRLLRGKIDTRYVPLALLVMAIGMADLRDLRVALPEGQDVVSLALFLSDRHGLAITGLFLLMSVAGGVYTVPLYATLQARSDERRRARIIAANNIVNAIFMVASSVFSMAMLKAGYSIPALFFVVGIMTLVPALYSVERLSYSLFATKLRILFAIFYRTRLKGMANLAPLKGQGVVYVANHASYLDGLLLAAYLPDHPVIATDKALAISLPMRLYHLFSGSPVLDSADPASFKYLVNTVKSGRSIVIFPEGRITRTGILMKVYETPGLIAHVARAPIVPVRIDGAQHSTFSMLGGKLRLKTFPRIRITILPAVSLKTAPEMSSRQRRQSFGHQLYKIMSNMMFASCNINKTLYEALLDAMRLQGAKTPIVEDTDRQPRTYKQLILVSRILGRKLTKFTGKDEYVGVMLPNGIGIVSVILSLMAYGRVPALLNFMAGLANLKSACKTAQLKTIVTSRRFIKIMNMESLVQELSHDVEVLYAEDMRKSIGLTDKLIGLFETRFARIYYKRLGIHPAKPAVVLFTSGSESVPKGVVLSHKNILANRYQIGTRIDLNASDILFNALPIFHSFGLSVGLFLPLLTGVKAFLYPTPLHYRIIPELIYEINATILISTDTFLSGYARSAHAYDFYSLRYVVAGGEKLKEETRRVWFEKFGIRILEGYGVTETAPVLAISTLMHYKTGTVGQLVPGVSYRIRPIEGLAKGGSLVVRGANVMLGYLKHDKPGVLQPPPKGWYDTGDVVEVDWMGFVKIVGRAKRFAKIGGEMISLAAVEAYVLSAYPDRSLGVVAVPDPRKGEQIILFTTDKAITREALIELARGKNLPELMVPRQVVVLDEMPLLGTGKIDYVKLNEMGVNRVAESTQ